MKYIFTLVVLAALLFTGCSASAPDEFVSSDNSGKLPDSFMLKLSLDGTSSGASRLTTSELVFEDGKIVYGFVKYDVSTCMGEIYMRYCELEMGTLSWAGNETDKEFCSAVQHPLTKKEVQEKIDSGEYKVFGQHNRFNPTYEIILPEE